MQHQYQTSLRCEACLSEVRGGLDGEERIDSWSVDLKSPQKALVVESNVPESMVRESVQRIFGEHGYTIEPLTFSIGIGKTSKDSSESGSGFKLSSYWPLALVVIHLFLACGYLAWRDAKDFPWSPMSPMADFMGGFFIVFAFFKWLSVPKFADAFATYDVIAKRLRIYALAYPAIETGLGIAFLFRVFPLATNLLTSFVMAVGLIGVVSAVRSGRSIQCACLGTAFNLPMSIVTIVENSVMLMMALVGLWHLR